jgi:gas vesicle protein
MCENSNSGFGNDRHHKSTGKDLLEVLMIILISVFSGFILGLLFAPQSGLKTRKKLVEKLKDIIDRGKFTLAEAKVMSEELLEKSKEKVGKVSSKIRGGSQADIH